LAKKIWREVLALARIPERALQLYEDERLKINLGVCGENLPKLWRDQLLRFKSDWRGHKFEVASIE
jgi:hypothetical protein